MDPWSGGRERYVKKICRQLTSNKLTQLDFDPYEISDEEWSVVAAALKSNTSLKKVVFFSEEVVETVVMSVSASLSLADAFLSHPNLEELSLFACMFDDFSAIALAIMQNSKLNRLKLGHCNMTRSRKASIAFLVRANALESLTLDGPHLDDDGNEIPVDLPGAFASNQSLKELVIIDDSGMNGPAITQATLVDIARMLRVNQGLETLSLDLCLSMNPSETITLLARGAKGHNSLKRLAIVWSGQTDERSAVALGDMVEHTPSLHELDLQGTRIGDEGAIQLSRALRREECTLESLDISHSGIGDAGTVALAAALSQNQTLVDLNVASNTIGRDGAIAIADALTTNNSLQTLEVYSNPLGDDGTNSIGQALRANHALKTITLPHFASSFIASIPNMSGLKKLSIIDTGDVDSESASALLKAIECNTTLEGFFTHGNRCITEIMPQVRRLTLLNRAGRRILKSRTEVPPSLWPRILGRSSGNDPEAIYFFLRENPHLFKKQSALGKRKRGQSGS